MWSCDWSSDVCSSDLGPSPTFGSSCRRSQMAGGLELAQSAIWSTCHPSGPAFFSDRIGSASCRERIAERVVVRVAVRYLADVRVLLQEKPDRLTCRAG